jgi:hypothetical protein
MTIGIINGNTYGSYIISASLTPAATLTITATEQTFTVPGLRVGDHVTVNPPSVTAGLLQGSARVSAANTLAINFVNPTAGSLTAPAGTYTISVLRPESQVAATRIGD